MLSRKLLKVLPPLMAACVLSLFPATSAEAAAATRQADFEGGDVSEFDGSSHSQSGTLSVVTISRTYHGAEYAQVSHPWYSVDWQEGTHVWYGAAFYIRTDTQSPSWAEVIRWDSAEGHEPGGFAVAGERGRLYHASSDGSYYTRLGDSFPLPRGRWFNLEIHQKFSLVAGLALSEAYIDGMKVTSSDTANSSGKRMDRVLFGFSYGEGLASTLNFDSANISPDAPEWLHVNDRLAGFESGDFSELDNLGVSATSNTTEGVTGERAYEGSKSLKVSYNGALGNSFGRVWYGNEGSKSLNWQKGTDVWYGAAFFVPDPARLRWTDLIRWDNYGVYGDPEQGGLLAEEGKLAIKRQNYDGSNYAKLVQGPAIPANRWFFVEVHQRFSDVNGEALTELYLDGQKVGASTTANSRGRTISTVRYGYVYNWDAGGPSALYTDRVSVSKAMRGP